MSVRYTLMAIPDGKAGIRATLKLMSKFTRQYKTAPAIRELALKIMRDSGVHQYDSRGKKNWIGQVRAIHEFCKNKINYIKDIHGVETVQTPIQTLRVGHGDCDDKSVLCASLLETIGHPTRFLAVGPGKNIYTHVFLETKIGGKWVAVECTESWPLGKRPKIKFPPMVEHN